MIFYNSAFEQGNMDLWRYINAFIIKQIIVSLLHCIASIYIIIRVIDYAWIYLYCCDLNILSKALLYVYDVCMHVRCCVSLSLAVATLCLFMPRCCHVVSRYATLSPRTIS